MTAGLRRDEPAATDACGGAEHALTSATCPGDRPRVWRRRKHARADELRDAALALFVEKGFDATLTEEIAARAGTSKGTLYLYYASKEQLLQAVVASPALQRFASMRPVVEHDGSSADALRAMLSDIWAHLRGEAVGSVLKLAIAEARRFPELMEFWLCAVLRPARASIAEVVLQGMDRGEFRKMDPEVAAHSLLLPMLMSCLHPHVTVPGAPADRCLDEGFIPQHVELVLHGLRA